MDLGEEILEAYELTNQEPPQPWSDAQRDAFHEWISSHSLPEGTSITILICEMNNWLPNQDHPFFRMTLFGADSIRKQHDQSPGLFKNGLLAVGSCPNGDLIAFDLEAHKGILTRKPKVGYVSHEGFWAPGETNARRHYLNAAPSMSHLLLNIAHDCLRNRNPRMDY